MNAKRLVAFSRHAEKRQDALALGADEYVATAEDQGWEDKYASSLDLILCAVSSSNMPLTDYINLLQRDGTFFQLGLPDDGLFKVGAGPIASQRRKLTGSFMGSPHEIRAMLQLAADKGIKPWVEQRPMSEANGAIVDMEIGKAKYRYVLVNDDV
jgi:D-arabinose 1-dehydrogenase-like Zn-dependent alcohol dehydrogenase